MTRGQRPPQCGAWALATLFVAAGALVAALAVPREPDRWSQIRTRGVVRVGHAIEPPYAYRDGDRVTGEAPEVAAAVLARLGIHRIEWVEVEFGSLIPQLLIGRYDMIASGMFILPERAQLIDFSRPSFCARTALLVARGNPHRLGSLTDLATDPRARLAVLAGAAEAPAARAAGVPAERVLEISNLALALAALREGGAEALALTRPTIQRLADRHPEFEIVTATGTRAGPRSCGGFGFHPRDRAFRDAFDGAMTDFVGGPEHVALVRPFGFTADELPAGAGGE